MHGRCNDLLKNIFGTFRSNTFISIVNLFKTKRNLKEYSKKRKRQLSFSLPGTLPKEGGLKIVALSSVFALIRSMMHNVDNLTKKRFTDSPSQTQKTRRNISVCFKIKS